MAPTQKIKAKTFIAIFCSIMAVTQVSCTQSSPANATAESAEKAPGDFQVKHVDALVRMRF